MKSAIIFLFLTAAIWGLSYSMQAEAMNTMKPLAFVFLRYLIGAAALLPMIIYSGKKFDKSVIAGGIICGISLAGGEILQQFGLLYTSAGKAGFLTALYVIMIPVIGVFINKKSNWKIWCASLLSVAGAYLLCYDTSMNNGVNYGDILMLICALFFALQFIAIAKFAPQADALHLAAIQFLTVAVISGIATLAAGEKISLSGIRETAIPLFYCGVIAIGFACTIQIAAQKYLHPVTATLLMSLESVFALLGGWFFLNEALTIRELSGCAVIFLAIILAQLPFPRRKTARIRGN